MPAIVVDGGESDQTRVGLQSRALVAPPEDTCGGAQTIPTAGPFPYLTTTVDNTMATTLNDPATTCTPSAALGLWYTFTPTTG